MKANEAPKKVYLHLTTGNRLLNGKYYERKPAKIRNNDKIIEYTRTDAIIEKAAQFFYDYNQKQVIKHGARATLGCGEYTINVDEFKKYIEGE